LAQMRPVMVRVSATSHGTPCDQSQSRAGSDSVPSAIRTTALSADTPLMQRPPLTTDEARALLSIKERRTA